MSKLHQVSHEHTTHSEVDDSLAWDKLINKSRHFFFFLNWLLPITFAKQTKKPYASESCCVLPYTHQTRLSQQALLTTRIKYLAWFRDWSFQNQERKRVSKDVPRSTSLQKNAFSACLYNPLLKNMLFNIRLLLAIDYSERPPYKTLCMNHNYRNGNVLELTY